MEPELDACSTIRMLTSRADNIAIGTSGYAGLPAASGWPPAEHQDHFWEPERGHREH
jgi:hypothetical protein